MGRYKPDDSGLNDSDRQHDRQYYADKAEERARYSPSEYVYWRETVCYVPASMSRHVECFDCGEQLWGYYVHPNFAVYKLCRDCFDKRYRPEGTR